MRAVSWRNVKNCGWRTDGGRWQKWPQYFAGPPHRKFPHPSSVIWPYDLFSPVESDRSDIEESLSLDLRDQDASALVSWNPEISM